MVAWVRTLSLRVTIANSILVGNKFVIMVFDRSIGTRDEVDMDDAREEERGTRGGFDGFVVLGTRAEDEGTEGAEEDGEGSSTVVVTVFVDGNKSDVSGTLLSFVVSTVDTVGGNDGTIDTLFLSIVPVEEAANFCRNSYARCSA